MHNIKKLTGLPHIYLYKVLPDFLDLDLNI